MVQNDGFTVVSRKKPNVKWAPLAKKDVSRLVHGPNAGGAGPSGVLDNTDGPTNELNVNLGPVKPNDEAAGLNKGAGLGCVHTAAGINGGLQRNDIKLGPAGKSDGHMGSAMGCNGNKGPVPLSSNDHYPPLNKSDPISPRQSKSSIDPNLMQNSGRRKGSGYFDVSRQNFGPRVSPIVETKNVFDTLQNEEDCYDTEHGLWEKEMLMVRKFYETNTHPPDEIFSSWSDKLKAYYLMLTKFDPVKEAMIETKGEDEVEVESETDESARDIARGV